MRRRGAPPGSPGVRGAPERRKGCRSATVACAAALLAGAVAAQTFDDAARLHEEGRLPDALVAYRAVGSSAAPAEERAAALNNACVLGGELGQLQRALADCRAALAMRRTGGDPVAIAETANNLALVLETLGRPAEATPLYREALAVARRLGDRESEAVVLGNLGALALAAGRYSDAMELYRQAAALAASAAGEPWAAEQLRAARINQGVVLEKVGAYREAVQLYRELLAEERDGDPRQRAALLVNAGVIHRNLDDAVTAAAAFEEAIALYQEAGDLAGLSNAWLNLALAQHLNLDRPRAAETSYRRALALAERTGDRAEEVQDLFYLGRLLLEQERLDEAEAMFRRCAEVAGSSGSAEGRWSAAEGLGRVAMARGDLERALGLLERGLAEIERVRAAVRQPEWRAGYFGDRRATYGATVAVLARRAARSAGDGDAERAFHVVQRAKARDLLDALGSGVPAAAGTPPAAADDDASAPEQPQSAALLRRRLEGDTLLEYFVAEGEIYRFAVERERVRLAVLGAAAPVLADVDDVHRALAGGQAPPAAQLERLGALLLGGDWALPSRGGALRIAPDGLLHYLPFELLPAPAAGVPLVELATVAYLPSGSTLPDPARRRPDWGPQLIGFAAADAGAATATTGVSGALPRLAAAERELATVAALLGGRSELHTGGAATELAFRQAMARRPRVLHLAAHAVVEEPPGGGAAVHLEPAGADDGRLTPAEIAATPGAAGLVVLAACRTALPGPGAEARALASFTGSFLAGGTPAVVATLWDVEDAATAVFMEQLYGELRRGRRPAEALRRTKLRLRADARWSAPSLWSAYVLVGEAAPVAPSPLRRQLLAALVGVAAAGVLWGMRSRSRRGRSRHGR